MSRYCRNAVQKYPVFRMDGRQRNMLKTILMLYLCANAVAIFLQLKLCNHLKTMGNNFGIICALSSGHPIWKLAYGP